ncbi:MAG: DUF2905 domain-containing protein [Chloroflexi bacterium]|nr:DUF2905 domain-containing protein [Chloroflexota bacterium]
MPYDQLGKLLIIAGGTLLVVGLAFLVFGRTLFGRLPGDITFISGNFSCVAPLVTMLLLSLLLTLVVNIVLRLFRGP